MKHVLYNYVSFHCTEHTMTSFISRFMRSRTRVNVGNSPDFTYPLRKLVNFVKMHLVMETKCIYPHHSSEFNVCIDEFADHERGNKIPFSVTTPLSISRDSVVHYLFQFDLNWLLLTSLVFGISVEVSRRTPPRPTLWTLLDRKSVV